MGICFSNKKEIKPLRKPFTSRIEDQKSNLVLAQSKDNAKEDNKEIYKINPQENKSSNNFRGSPTSSRTNIIEKKNTKDDLKEEIKEIKTDRNSITPKIDKEDSVNIKAIIEKDFIISDNNFINKYQTIQNENIDINDTFDKLINFNLNISEIDNDNVVINEVKVRPLYNLVDCYIINNYEYSTECDWTQILKKAKFISKLSIAKKILLLKERKWNKENILHSDIIKDNRENIDSFLLLKYLNSRIKLQEHFNWLVWAVAMFYFSMLLSEEKSEKDEYFKFDEIGLPSIESFEWTNGFEWKGIFIRIQVELESKQLFNEIKSLNYLFFEYIQIIDTFKCKNDCNNLLSNELIFPLISYVKNNSLVLLGSACINKYNYDFSFLDNLPNDYKVYKKDNSINNYNTVNNEKLNTFGIGDKSPRKSNYFSNNYNVMNSHVISPSVAIDNPLLRHNPKVNVYYSQNLKTDVKIDSKKIPTITNKDSKQSINFNQVSNNKILNNYDYKNQYASEGNCLFRKSSSFTIYKNKINKNESRNSFRKDHNPVKNNNLSRIQANESFHLINLTQNVNQDINTESYNREDLNTSSIFSKLRDRNLMKVIDDINENEDCNQKFKFLIFSAEELIPNLVDSDKFYNYILFDEDDKIPFKFFNGKNFNEVFNQKSNEKIYASIRPIIIENKINMEVKITNEILHRIVTSTNHIAKSIKDLKELRQSKKSMNFKKKVDENQKNFDYENYENHISNLKFKIYFSNNENKEKKNNKINDFFLNIYSKQIILTEERKKILSTIQPEQYFFKYQRRNYDNHNKSLCGKNIVAYGLQSCIKLKYSLINNQYKSEFSSYFLMNLINNLAKVLDSYYNINNTFSLENLFHRYGVNKSFEFFVLMKVKNSDVADLIRLSLLSKLIKKVLYFNEGINIESKIFLMNIMSLNNNTRDIKGIMLDSGFTSINELSLQNIHFQKIFMIIQSILHVSASPKEFSSHFYENFNFFIFTKVMKLKLLNDYFDLKTDFSNKYSVESIIQEFIGTANRKPFLFLSVLEQELNISINQFIKFKASISRENFLNEFKPCHIIEKEMIAKSYINLSEISYYLLAKCIFTSKSSKKLDSLKEIKDKSSNSNIYINDGSFKKQPSISGNDKKILFSRNNNEIKYVSSLEKSSNNGINDENESSFYLPNKLDAKISIKNTDNSMAKYLKINNNIQDKIYKIIKFPINKMDLPKINNNNLKVNANNITKINNINIRYTDNKGNCNDSKSRSLDVRNRNLFPKKINTDKNVDNYEESDSIQQIKLSLLDDLELPIPAILYKLNFVNEDNINNNKKGRDIYKYLSNRYIFSKIDIFKDWKSQLEILLNDSVSFDCSESIILNLYIILFLQEFFIESNFNNSKEQLYRIKDWMKTHNFYQPEQLAIINLLEGMITEKKNYVESEEFFTKSIIFSLLIYGDPRGRGNNGSIFLLYPVWKICRQSCILENFLIHENFKELFYAQDNQIKTLMENIYKINKIENEIKLNEIKNENIKPQNISKLDSIKSNFQQIKNSIEIQNKISNDISEIQLNIEENLDEKLFNSKDSIKISLDNYQLFKQKYFSFPSISDVKTSYNSYFSSEKFISFFVRNLPIFLCSNNIWNDDTLRFLNLNIYTPIDNDTYSNIESNSNVSQKGKKPKGEIFSSYMYDSLLEKFNFKKTPPKGIVLTWGNNSHNETSHNNYEKMYLPRLCFKIKEEEIISVKSGWEFNLALSKDKQVFSWGNNEAGQCGLDLICPVIFSPTRIETLNKIKMITCGNEHSMALNESNEIFTWGRGKGGVLGYSEEGIVSKPRKIENFFAESVCAGSLHNIAIGRDGSLYSWGCGEGGQLGHSEAFLVANSSSGCLSIPSKIEGLKQTKIIMVSCGEAHSLALTYDNKVYGWGFTSNGQLGLGFCADSFEIGHGMAISRILDPKLLTLNKLKISDIQCGKSFSTFITDNGELLVCGVNDLFQLGVEMPTTTDHLFYKDEYNSKCSDIVFPLYVECFQGMSVKRVACGENHCLALIEDQNSMIQTLWSWGSNRFGQLGLGNQIKTSFPKPLNFLLGQNVVDIACGAFHSICVVSNDIDILDHKDNMKKLKQISNYFSEKWNFS